MTSEKQSKEVLEKSQESGLANKEICLKRSKFKLRKRTRSDELHNTQEDSEGKRIANMENRQEQKYWIGISTTDLRATYTSRVRQTVFGL